jgi:predicted kinase
MTRAVDERMIAFCPGCGGPSSFTLHDDRIEQRKRIAIRPISPRCLRCGGDLVIQAPVRGQGRTLVALTGTCGSGKSTTAELLVSRHGFQGIDGNGVQDVLRSRGGPPPDFNGPAMLDEIAREIDVLLSLGQDIVLAHVILPEDLPRYRAIFRARELRFLIVVLDPPYATALRRCSMRTSFRSVTPEAWVERFHEAARRFEAADDLLVLDNSVGAVEDAVRAIMDRLRG